MAKYTLIATNKKWFHQNWWTTKNWKLKNDAGIVSAVLCNIDPSRRHLSEAQNEFYMRINRMVHMGGRLVVLTSVVEKRPKKNGEFTFCFSLDKLGNKKFFNNLWYAWHPREKYQRDHHPLINRPISMSTTKRWAFYPLLSHLPTCNLLVSMFHR